MTHACNGHDPWSDIEKGRGGHPPRPFLVLGALFDHWGFDADARITKGTQFQDTAKIIAALRGD